MRHLTRRAIQRGDWLPPKPPAIAQVSVGGRRRWVPVPLILLFLLCPAGDANAQVNPLNSALRGDYSVSLHRSCATLTGSPPVGGALDIGINGITTFNGAGAGSFTGRSLVPIVLGPTVTLAGAQADQTCTVTYTVNPDGTVALQVSCTLHFTSGPNTGDDASLSTIIQQGQLSLDGTVVLLSETAPNVETFTCPTCNGPGGPDTGFTQQRLCTGSGVATSRR